MGLHVCGRLPVDEFAFTELQNCYLSVCNFPIYEKNYQFKNKSNIFHPWNGNALFKTLNYGTKGRRINKLRRYTTIESVSLQQMIHLAYKSYSVICLFQTLCVEGSAGTQLASVPPNCFRVCEVKCPDP